jgi:hypothetical protein
VEPAVRTVYGLPYRWGLREASAAYVLGDTSTYKEKKFSAEVVHKECISFPFVFNKREERDFLCNKRVYRHVGERT